MIPNPILKVLSTIRTNRVQSLLMGGQACILYGAAEFSRDADLAILADEANLANLREALAELQADVIAVPAFDVQYLQRGHAIHFRCKQPEVSGVRLDIMSVMRGVAPFAELWRRRTTVSMGSENVDVMGLEDLVAAKKTQRDKDWPMIRRLVDTNYHENEDKPTEDQIAFWFHEMRTPSLIAQLATRYPKQAGAAAMHRPVVKLAISGADDAALSKAMHDEELYERAADRAYWEPLRRELEALRHANVVSTHASIELSRPY